MEIKDRGYRFKTVPHEDPNLRNVAHVDGHYERFQKQAPIRKGQDFELEFYGRGGGMVLGVTAMPRRAAPSSMAALRRASSESRSASVATVISPGSLATDPLLPTAPASLSVIALEVGPEFHSPFDDDFFNPVVNPLPLPPDGPGGGGGGGTYHSAVRIRLFMFGRTEPIETWELPEGIGDRVRRVKFEPEGFPAPDAPVRRTTWWRMVVTPLGPDPVEVHIEADVRIGDVPIRTTALNVRLTNHLFRVALEALMPQAVMEGDTLTVSIGKEVAELAGIAPKIAEESILDIGTSNARLRSLDITAISGRELHTIALDHYRERVKRIPLTDDSEVDNRVAVFFGSQLKRLLLVQPDDICIRFQAAFIGASVSVWGFDAASLRGGLGEFILAFDQRLHALRPFSFLDVDFTTLAEIGGELAKLVGKNGLPDANKKLENHFFEAQDSILKYMKAFLERAVGQSSTVYDFKLRNKAWQIRHSEDPVIPPPRDDTRPPVTGDIFTGGGLVELVARHNSALGLDVVAPPTAEVEVNDNLAPASRARKLPRKFLTAGEQLDRLDRHQSIVVVMMENRSYDHMLGDLMNARPRPTNPYDGPPNNVKETAVGGFLHGVPLVHTRDLHLGTAIPVSPRHNFDAVQFQIGDGTEEGRSSGDMLGFALDLYHKSDSPQLACTIYGEEELSVHYKLADEFLTCDRWFAAHPGPTWPNRFATLMGTIPELDNFEIDDPRLGFLKDQNIFDVLSAARIDWRVFESDLSLIRMFDRFRLDDRHVVPIDDSVDGLEATLRKAGPLPRVMFIEPNFADIPPIKTADDDHPPADLVNGQAFISRVCDLIWDTNRFDEVLLVITYDEHGGFYDHVPPPGTPKSELDPVPPLIEGGPTWLGVRVPTFVVSPFVSSGAISRTIFDHTSILKTILVHNRGQLSNAAMLSFGERVNQAKDLSVLLDLPNPRQAPVPFVRRTINDKPRKPVFGDLVDLQGILKVTPSFSPIVLDGTPGHTPRQVIFTERTNPLGNGKVEPRDFHAALTKLLRPRRTQ
jgi:phospholipase C